MKIAPEYQCLDGLLLFLLVYGEGGSKLVMLAPHSGITPGGCDAICSARD